MGTREDLSEEGSLMEKKGGKESFPFFPLEGEEGSCFIFLGKVELISGLASREDFISKHGRRGKERNIS